MGIYENVCTYAEKNNISIHALETRAGLGNGTISKWKQFEPNLSNLKKVAVVLGIDVKKLIA